MRPLVNIVSHPPQQPQPFKENAIELNVRCGKKEMIYHIYDEFATDIKIYY